jgi:hypothetical protein
MFSDADTLRQISAVRSKFFHGPWHQATRVSAGEDHLFSMVDDEKRKVLKAKLGPGVSLSVNLLLLILVYDDSRYQMYSVINYLHHLNSTRARSSEGSSRPSTGI